jgi:hypothetical protein
MGFMMGINNAKLYVDFKNIPQNAHKKFFILFSGHTASYCKIMQYFLGAFCPYSKFEKYVKFCILMPINPILVNKCVIPFKRS